MDRIPASETTRKRLAERLAGEVDKSELLRQAIRLIIEKALEAEVSEALGRGYYEHGHGHGYRTGYRTGTLKSAEGPFRYLSRSCAIWTPRYRRNAGGKSRHKRWRPTRRPRP